jgi:hypothetical protein
VRDAAGERADALQPLRAQELLLEPLALGDVRVDRERSMLGRAAFIAHERPSRSRP